MIYIIFIKKIKLISQHIQIDKKCISLDFIKEKFDI